GGREADQVHLHYHPHHRQDTRPRSTAVIGCPRRRGDRINGHFVAVHESASLIGRLGSSAFRLSMTAVSMSLAGSCFSTESAQRPFHHGIRRRGGTIF